MSEPTPKDHDLTVIAGADAGVTRVLGGAPENSPPVDDTQDRAVTRVQAKTLAEIDRASNAPALEAGALAPGTRLAEFEVTHILGQGGFGVVYEAWDHALERVVAIKEYMPSSLALRHPDGSVAPQSSSKSETFQLGMRSFINEARLLAQFDHPSLLKVYRFWEEKGTAYMVMPLYRGRTLREELARKPQQASEAWLKSVVDSVSQALEEMHAANCYHRDIAPDNILLLDETDLPVVLDFGAARRVISDQSQAVTVILKPGYAPVEQYGDVPGMAQGPWTDVYALAAVLHLAIAGRVPPPSVGRMLSDSYVPLLDRDDLRKQFSPEFLRAIDLGLSVKPEGRPQSMAAFRRELGLDGPQARQTAGSNPASSSGSAAIGPSKARSHAKRPIQIAALVAAVAIAGGGVVWWVQKPAAKDSAATTSKPETPVAASAESGAAAAPPVAAEQAVPAPAAPSARGPAESLAALRSGADATFEVHAAAANSSMQIGKDRLAFEVSSNRAGHVYVYLLSSGGELYLLFPNSIDKRNTIKPGSPLQLPRASWPLNAGGPPGKDRFAVVVSELERDYTSVGVQTDGLFPQFPLPVLAALEATRTGEASPLLGQPVCASTASCKDIYGVAFFEVDQR